MLYFMKVYPKKGPGCWVVCASAGAVNSKTHRKWVWAFIKAIAKLVDVVVSNTIRSAKQDDIYGASNIVLLCPGS